MEEGSPSATADRQEKKKIPENLPTLEKSVAGADEAEKEALPSNGKPTEESVETVPSENVERNSDIVE